MTSQHETPSTKAVEVRPSGEQDELVAPAAAKGHRHSRRSVRELERISNNLRLAGEYRVSETLDMHILSLLEKKIYRKIIAKSRREGTMKNSAVA